MKVKILSGTHRYIGSPRMKMLLDWVEVDDLTDELLLSYRWGLIDIDLEGAEMPDRAIAHGLKNGNGNGNGNGGGQPAPPAPQKMSAPPAAKPSRRKRSIPKGK